MTYTFILRTVAYSYCIGIKISHYYDIKWYLIFLFEAIPEQWNITVNTSPSFIKALWPVLPQRLRQTGIQMFINCGLWDFVVAHWAVDGDQDWRIVCLLITDEQNDVFHLLSLLHCGRGGLGVCLLEVIKDMFRLMVVPWSLLSSWRCCPWCTGAADASRARKVGFRLFRASKVLGTRPWSNWSMWTLGTASVLESWAFSIWS